MLSETPAAAVGTDLVTDTVPSTWLRIAIPSFRVGWRRSYARNPKSDGPTVDELQSLFKDDLRRTATANVVLTDREYRDYNRLVDLRAALYAPTYH